MEIVRTLEVNNYKGPSFAAAGLAVAGLLVFIAVWTSYYTVPAESEGVVLRFGRYLATVPSGLHFKWPFGIGSVAIVPT